jgi:hypothetical protein
MYKQLEAAPELTKQEPDHPQPTCFSNFIVQIKIIRLTMTYSEQYAGFCGGWWVIRSDAKEICRCEETPTHALCGRPQQRFTYISGERSDLAIFHRHYGERNSALTKSRGHRMNELEGPIEST